MKTTQNLFLVGVSGGSFDRISIMIPVIGSIDRDSALNLAAWLIAIALPPDKKEEFDAYLDRILNT